MPLHSRAGVLRQRRVSLTGHIATVHLLLMRGFRRIVVFAAVVATGCGEVTPEIVVREPMMQRLCCGACCFVDGRCWLNGAMNPDNDCQHCDSATPLGWTIGVGACDDGNDCTTGDSCIDGSCISNGDRRGLACADGDPCTADDTCDENSICVGVSRACSSGTHCDEFVCDTGACVDPDGGRCFGESECVESGVDNPNNPCEVCDPTVTTARFSPKVRDTSCGAAMACKLVDGEPILYLPEVWDGAGVCLRGRTTDCGVYTKCLPNAADCASRCDGEADCLSGATCEGGECVGHRGVGEPCNTDNLCESGACVDAVCCGESCDAPCMGCSAATTDGLDGDCLPIRTGEDPRDHCDADDPMSCGRDGACDGTGNCQLFGTEAVCGAATCTLFNELLGDRCDGFGNCVDSAAVSCFPGICRNDSCDLSCADDSQCAQGGWCAQDRGQCSDANRPPVAVITGRSEAAANTTTALSGADSFDPDGDVLTYRFIQVAGSPVDFTEQTGADVTVTIPTLEKPETLVFELYVDDGEQSGAPATHFMKIRIPDLPWVVGCLACSASNSAPLWALTGVLLWTTHARVCRHRRHRP